MSDSATTRRPVWHAGLLTRRQRADWRVLLTTARKGNNNIGCVVAINNVTRSVPNEPAYLPVF
jgi:hypothetical protein